MPFYDNEMLIRNINDLMRNNGMTQVQLAEILGMSQSNVSKALSTKDKKSFTLDQVAGIAKHFNVSVDSLLGNHPRVQDDVSIRNIARFIAILLSKGIAQHHVLDVEETVFERHVSHEGGYSVSFDPEKKPHDYHAIYFSNYWQPAPPNGPDDEVAFAEYCEASQVGNESRYGCLNDFLRKLLKILDIYKTEGLDPDTCKRIVDDYIDQLPNG